MGVVFTGTVISKHVIKQLNIKNEVAGCWSEHVEQVLVHRNADKYEVDLTGGQGGVCVYTDWDRREETFTSCPRKLAIS